VTCGGSAMDGRLGIETVAARDPSRSSEIATRDQQPRTPPLKIVLSSMAGFVAGALFWHLVGFWSFVNEAVYYKRGDSPEAASSGRAAVVAAKAQSRQAGVAGPVRSTSGNCSLVPIDRTGGAPQAVSCEGVAVVKFQPPRGVQRADFADFGPAPVPVLISSGTAPSGEVPAVSGWSARVDKTGGGNSNRN
jgi:hypothetical protein